jgi:hypothetical protein
MSELTSAGLTIEAAQSVTPDRPQPRPSPTRAPKAATLRNTLIPNTEYDLKWKQSQGKIALAWTELCWNLKFSKNEIAIPIVFRVLLELSLDYAISKRSSPTNSSLKSKAKHIAKALNEEGELNKKELSDIERFCGDNRSPREIEALNRVVHSSSFTMAKEDLIALWTSLEKLVLLSITK